jgi:beta-N-acetylhexosaminidase
MKKKYLLLIFVLTLFIVSGCIRINTKEKVGIRGEIGKVNLNDKGKVVSIYVEGKIEADTTHDKASVSITEKTKIYSTENKATLSVNDLKEGMKVEIVFEGGVRESYPVQADAKSIKVKK